MKLPEYLTITSDIEASIKNALENKNYSNIFLLTDQNTFEFCYPLVKNYFPEHEVIQISAGEQFKNLDTCSNIWQALTNAQADRNALFINLGGGVIGDMGGFCAATYKRGIDFMTIPTTLLSQVDASIGGKLGIDFQGLKNHIGVFSMPEKVIIYDEFLKTLPEKELRSGFAEIIKHHLIRDKTGWESLATSDWKRAIGKSLLSHSVGIKSDVVQEDPFEKGVRKILNYGHTAGHAMESEFLDSENQILHGEAIAAGMIIENFIANAKGMLDSDQKLEIENYILSIYGKIDIPGSTVSNIIARVYQDKKNMGNKVRAALLQSIGNAVWDIEISEKELEQAFEYYRAI